MERTDILIRRCGVAALALLAFPAYGLLQSGLTGATAVALGAIAVFAFLYTRLWLGTVSGRPALKALPSVVSLAVCAVGFNVLYPAQLSWAVLFVYVVAAAGFALPRRAGFVAVVGSTLLALATLLAMVPFLSPETQRGLSLGASTALLQLLLIGLGAVGVRQLLETMAELRAAREEIAHLAVESERHRFARDLHDLLGHSLSLITLKSELAGRLVLQQPGNALAEVNDIERVARGALREVREAVQGYRQASVATELAGARTALAAAGIACAIEHTAGALPPHADALFAWAVREGVTNVARHSLAQRCVVRLARHDDVAWAEIVDDGVGSVTEPGNGLRGLGERVAISGGRLEAGALPTQGYRLRVTLPLQRPTIATGAHHGGRP